MKTPRNMPSVPPVVFNERLAAHLKTLDKGAEALNKTTRHLAQRLDEHEQNEHLFRGMKGTLP